MERGKKGKKNQFMGKEGKREKREERNERVGRALSSFRCSDGRKSKVDKLRIKVGLLDESYEWVPKTKRGRVFSYTGSS